jgi:2-dehydropantoate 2-reductase
VTRNGGTHTTHAVLGAGGVGLLVGGALARAGRDVVLLLRPQTLAAFDGTIRVDSVVLGDFVADARATTRLTERVDVLWVATKATQLDEALAAAPAEHVRTVVPLLNGVDHLAGLRERYPRVVAASISVESERVAPAQARQTSPFVRFAFGPGGETVAEELREAGFDDVTTGLPDVVVLWSKLAFLAPLALTTTAADAPIGLVRSAPEWRERLASCRDEVCAVAAAEGAPQDSQRLAALVEAAAPEMRTSMQKDVAAGRAPELDAIGGAVLRAADRHRISVPVTRELVELVASRPR